jgi:hypothetical protein
MTYEKTPIKKSDTSTISKNIAVKAASTLSTPRILLLLANRHKVALLATGNIVLVLNWAIPAWPEMVKSLIG